MSISKRRLGLVFQGASVLRQAREHPEGANEGYLAVHNVVACALHGQGDDIVLPLAEAVAGVRRTARAGGAH